MPRKTSFSNRALLRSDVKRYWPLLFRYVLVWVVILPLQLVQAGRYQTLEPLVQAQLHNAVCSALYASVVMALISGCLRSSSERRKRILSLGCSVCSQSSDSSFQT